MKRSTKQYLGLVLKGMAMGAADVVPGVSGGTIAFITGIYEELISSINSFNLGLFKTLKTEGIKGAWKAINGNFLVALFSGILISVFSLAKLITFLLETSPILVWSFFFGLILASIWLMLKQVKKWNAWSVIAILLGTVLVYYITTIQTTGTAESNLYILLSGMVAICAMILPGISGSFLLVLMGAYQVVLAAVSDRKLTTLAMFGTGCVLGLLAFSKLLNYLFKNFKNVTIAALTGFLIGSLNKVWPWKHVEKIFVKHSGEVNEEVVNLVEKNVLPNDYDIILRKGEQIIGYADAEPFLWPAIGLAIVGFALIIILERFGKSEEL